MNKLNLKKIILKNEGFSLIELMVVLVILSLIIIGLVTIFSGGVRSWISGQSQLQAQREARQAMDRMVREIREGESIASGSDQTNVTVNYLASFVGFVGKDPVTFSLLGNTINREGNPLIDNVQSFEVTYPDDSKVHILLEIDVDDDENPDITLNSDVNLRNYGL